MNIDLRVMVELTVPEAWSMLEALADQDTDHASHPLWLALSKKMAELKDDSSCP